MTYRFSEEKKSRVLELRKQVVEDCEECGGEGYIPVTGVPGSLRRCECMIVLRYLMDLVVANIPADYWRLSLAMLEIPQVYKDSVTFYLERFAVAMQKGLGLVFLGPNGVGKTSLMCEIGKAALVRGYDVRYFTLSHYITAIQKNLTEELEDMERGQLILIDELDKKYIKRGSDYVVKTLDESLRKLLGMGKTLGICTNWTVEDVRENLGESTMSLLQRRCDFTTMDGEDYSSKLQENFWDALKTDVNFFDDAIVDMAWSREEACGE